MFSGSYCFIHCLNSIHEIYYLAFYIHHIILNVIHFLSLQMLLYFVIPIPITPITAITPITIITPISIIMQYAP